MIDPWRTRAAFLTALKIYPYGRQIGFAERNPFPTAD